MNAYGEADARRRRVAVERCAALLEVAALRACGASLADARARVAAQRGIAIGALQRWGRLVRDVPRAQWSAHLVPTRRGRSAP